MVQALQQTMEIHQLFVDMAVDVPVVQLQQVPLVLTVQAVKNIRFLRQFTDKVLTCPFVQ